MMKLLLDESVPRKLLRSFPPRYEVHTVPDMGWAGITNGELLALAQEQDFHALITADRGIEHQQNTSELSIYVIILIAYRTHVDYLAPLVPEVVRLLDSGLDYDIYSIAE